MRLGVRARPVPGTAKRVEVAEQCQFSLAANPSYLQVDKLAPVMRLSRKIA
jgi:hypothetical protein